MGVFSGRSLARAETDPRHDLRGFAGGRSKAMEGESRNGARKTERIKVSGVVLGGTRKQWEAIEFGLCGQIGFCGYVKSVTYTVQISPLSPNPTLTARIVSGNLSQDRSTHQRDRRRRDGREPTLRPRGYSQYS